MKTFFLLCFSSGLVRTLRKCEMNVNGSNENVERGERDRTSTKRYTLVIKSRGIFYRLAIFGNNNTRDPFLLTAGYVHAMKETLFVNVTAFIFHAFTSIFMKKSMENESMFISLLCAGFYCSFGIVRRIHFFIPVWCEWRKKMLSEFKGR